MPVTFSHPGNARACTTTPGRASCVASQASTVAARASKSCARSGAVISTTSTPVSGRRRCATPGPSGSEFSQAIAAVALVVAEDAQREGQEEAMR